MLTTKQHVQAELDSWATSPELGALRSFPTQFEALRAALSTLLHAMSVGTDTDKMSEDVRREVFKAMPVYDWPGYAYFLERTDRLCQSVVEIGLLQLLARS